MRRRGGSLSEAGPLARGSSSRTPFISARTCLPCRTSLALLLTAGLALLVAGLGGESRIAEAKASSDLDAGADAKWTLDEATSGLLASSVRKKSAAEKRKQAASRERAGEAPRRIASSVAAEVGYEQDEVDVEDDDDEEVEDMDEPFALVATVNGALHAIEPATGDVLWSTDVGGTVVRSYQAPDTTSSGVLVPGVDGALFIQSEGHLRHFPLRISDIVKRSPIYQQLPDGRRLVVVSSTTSRSFRLEAATGRVIRTIDSDFGSGGLENDQESFIADEYGGELPTLVVSRRDHRVRAFDEASGKEVWNFTYGGVVVNDAPENHLASPTLLSQEDLERIMALPGAPRFAALSTSATNGPYGNPNTNSLAGSLRNGGLDRLAVSRILLPDGQYQLYAHAARDGPKVEGAGDAVNSNLDKALEPHYPRSDHAIVGVYPLLPLSSPEDEEYDEDDDDFDDPTWGGSLPRDAPVRDLALNREVSRILDKASRDRERAEQQRRANLVLPSSTPAGELNYTWKQVLIAGVSFIVGVVVISSFVASMIITRSFKNHLSSPTNASSGLNDDSGAMVTMVEEASEPGGGQRVGKLVVHMARVKGLGCNGTIVVEGTFEGRAVAVKRMQSALYDRANKEVDLLIRSEGHLNVVRYLAKEETPDFVFLALELCSKTLDQALDDWLKDEEAQKSRKQQLAAREYYGLGEATRGFLRELVSATQHLHDNNIVHCDIKPQNVLVVPRSHSSSPDASHSSWELGYRWIPKLSDMGLSRNVDREKSSFKFTDHARVATHNRSTAHHTNQAHGPGGTLGWRAPELMSHHPHHHHSKNAHQRVSRKVDVFSLGCLIFYLVDDGHHPFGEWIVRESNIAKGQPTLLSNLLTIGAHEVHHLVKQMIATQPELRPSTSICLFHPLFWQAKTRLDFLCDASDCAEAVTTTPEIHDSLEAKWTKVIPRETSWLQALKNPTLANDANTAKHRTYNFATLRDMIRYIRNKRHHTESRELREELTHDPRVFLAKFCGPCPNLVPCVYDWVLENFEGESKFAAVLGTHVLEHRRATHQLGSHREIADDEYVLAAKRQSQQIEATRPRWFSTEEEWSSAVSSTLAQHNSSKSKKPMGSTLLYKTTLCNHWEQSKGKACLVGDACGFAHGRLELRALPVDKSGKATKHASLVPYEPTATVSLDSTSEVLTARSWYFGEDAWIQSTASDAIKATIPASSNIKSILCTHWVRSQGSFCQRGGQCQFAHGPADVRLPATRFGRHNRQQQWIELDSIFVDPATIKEAFRKWIPTGAEESASTVRPSPGGGGKAANVKFSASASKTTPSKAWSSPAETARSAPSARRSTPTSRDPPNPPADASTSHNFSWQNPEKYALSLAAAEALEASQAARKDAPPIHDASAFPSVAAVKPPPGITKLGSAPSSAANNDETESVRSSLGSPLTFLPNRRLPREPSLGVTLEEMRRFDVSENFQSDDEDISSVYALQRDENVLSVAPLPDLGSPISAITAYALSGASSHPTTTATNKPLALPFIWPTDNGPNSVWAPISNPTTTSSENRYALSESTSNASQPSQ